MLRLALPALLLLGGCAMTAEDTARADAAEARDAARLDEALAGLEAGQPVNCISTLGNSSVAVYGDALLYRDGARYYLNRTSGGCFGLKRDDIIVTKSYGSQLCRGDIVRTVDRSAGFQSGACSFGEFVPYRRAPRG